MDTLRRHFQQCTVRSKNAWAAARAAPETACVADALPDVSDPALFALPSPEVGRAHEFSDDVNDVQALFPWSQLGEARIAMSTPLRPLEAHANESFSSAYASMVEAAAYTLPSPHFGREGEARASPHTPYSPRFSQRTSLAPGVLSHTDISLDGFEGRVSSYQFPTHRIRPHKNKRGTSTKKRTISSCTCAYFARRTGRASSRLTTSRHAPALRVLQQKRVCPAPNAVWHVLALATCAACHLEQTHAYGPLAVYM